MSGSLTARRFGRAATVLATLFIGVPAATAAPGDFDPSFGNAGVVSLPVGIGPHPSSQINAVAPLPDGRLLIAGWATKQSSHRALLVGRLKPDGELDPSFGNGGTRIVQLGNGDSADSEANALLPLPDGKILVGGLGQGDVEHGFVVARLTSNGRFDSSFGDGGKAFAPLPPSGPELPIIYALALQPDGKILAAGTGQVTDLFGHGIDQFLVDRLNSDGTLDGSFGRQGEVLTQLARPSELMFSQAHALALQPNGKILVGGFAGGVIIKGIVARLDPAHGNFDPSFGVGGKVRVSPSRSFSDTLIFGLRFEPGGRLLAAGWADVEARKGDVFGPLTAELNVDDGTLDTTFGTHGVSFTPMADQPFFPDLAFAPGDKIVYGGQASDASFLLARFASPDGVLDPAFGHGGIVSTNPAGSSAAAAAAVALQPDGKIVAGGEADGQAIVVRLLGP